MCERALSIEITSASSAPIDSMMSLKSETHVRVDLGRVVDPGRREPEALDGAGEIVAPVAGAEGEPLTQSRLVDLDREDSRSFEVGDLVPQRERELPADRLARESSRTNDHCIIVTGPVGISFTGRSVRVCA